MMKVELSNQVFLESSPVCTQIIDLDFNLQYLNNTGIRELKIDNVNEFLEKPYPFYFFPESFRIEMINKLIKTKESGEKTILEAPVLDTEGNEIRYYSTLVPIFDNQRNLDCIMIMSINTTERHKIEQKLRLSEERMRELIYQSPMSIQILDLEGRTIHVNRAWEKLWGINWEEFTKLNFNILKDEQAKKAGAIKVS